MMRRSLAIVAVLAVALSNLSCEPSRFEASNYETVSTFFAPGTDFSSYATFALADDQGLIEIGDDLDISHEHDEEIFDQIRGNFLNRGYEEVDDPETADVVVFAGVTTVDWQSGGCYYWWDYWCWYWCYPGYGWCYPVYTAFTSGTLVVAMIEREARDDEAEAIPLVWIAGMAGYIEGLSNLNNVLQGVDQAFVQSPYLRQ